MTPSPLGSTYCTSGLKMSTRPSGDKLTVPVIRSELRENSPCPWLATMPVTGSTARLRVKNTESSFRLRLLLRSRNQLEVDPPEADMADGPKLPSTGPP